MGGAWERLLDGIGARSRQNDHFQRFVARITVVKTIGPEDWGNAAKDLHDYGLSTSRIHWSSQ
jgi:hypothetical protein